MLKNAKSLGELEEVDSLEINDGMSFRNDVKGVELFFLFQGKEVR